LATLPHRGGNRIPHAGPADFLIMQGSTQTPEPGAEPRGRVLVVEDDPEAALFAVYALEKRGCFAVTHTSDPVEAIALAANEQWDLALTDLDLPVISGTELITALRRVAPGLPVILVTAHAGGDVAGDRAAQPDRLLVKPVSAERLLAAAVALAAGPASGPPG
jgi:two-component system, NtrC family, response regulator HydG